MPIVTSFKEYLEKKDRKENTESLLYYHYLQYFCKPEQPITAQLFNEFYRKILLFPRWQNNLFALKKTLVEDITHFAKFHNIPPQEIEEISQTTKWQLIEIKQLQDLVYIVESHLKKDLSKGDKLKVIPFNTNRVLALILKFDGQLKVLSFGLMTIINQGDIEPLFPLSELHYLSNLSLRPFCPQRIEIDENNSLHFHITNAQCKGYVCEGAYLKKSQEFSVKTLKENKTLFTKLKQIENHYIQIQSDPHYQTLIQNLHNHYRKMLLSQTSTTKTQLVLSQAHTNIKNLYPNDQLLYLLTSNIEFHYQNKHNSTINEEPTEM